MQLRIPEYIRERQHNGLTGIDTKGLVVARQRLIRIAMKSDPVFLAPSPAGEVGLGVGLLGCGQNWFAPDIDRLIHQGLMVGVTVAENETVLAVGGIPG